MQHLDKILSPHNDLYLGHIEEVSIFFVPIVFQCVACSYAMEAPSESRICQLTSVIQIKTANYDIYIISQRLPPEEIARARDAVLGANSELQALLLGLVSRL